LGEWFLLHAVCFERTASCWTGSRRARISNYHGWVAGGLLNFQETGVLLVALAYVLLLLLVLLLALCAGFMCWLYVLALCAGLPARRP